MSQSDAKKATQRYATSKIESEQDLWHLHSFGFRGEALAAISSVSVFQIQTAEQGAQTGVSLMYRSGDLVQETVIPGIGGTEIIVENLFFSVPARLKFLKADSTEEKYIRSLLTQIALIHPEVEFIYNSNGKEVFHYGIGQSQKERFQSVLPKDITEGL
ncbi:MAG: DNA mismatch repair protein MutL, partial [Patescibacteria group bacterium]|nr:DNA mismatch repair protein MutL [Patescibacteria group bacterium]